MAEFALLEGLKRRSGALLGYHLKTTTTTEQHDENELRLDCYPIFNPLTKQYSYAFPQADDGSLSFVPVHDFLEELCTGLSSSSSSSNHYHSSSSSAENIERVVIKWDSLRGSTRQIQDRLLACMGELPSLKAVFIGGRTKTHRQANSSLRLHQQQLPIYASSLIALLQKTKAGRTHHLVDLHVLSHRSVVFDNLRQVEELAAALHSHPTLLSVSLGSLCLRNDYVSADELPEQQQQSENKHGSDPDIISADPTCFFLDPMIHAFCTIPNLQDVTIQGPPLLVLRRLPSCISPGALNRLLPHVRSLSLRRVRLDMQHTQIIAAFMKQNSTEHQTLQNLDLLGNFLGASAAAAAATTTQQTEITTATTTSNTTITAITTMLIQALAHNYTLREFKLDGLTQVQRDERNRILCLNRAGRQPQKNHSFQEWFQYLSNLLQHNNNNNKNTCCAACFGQCALRKDHVLLSSLFEAIRDNPHHVVTLMMMMAATATTKRRRMCRRNDNGHYVVCKHDNASSPITDSDPGFPLPPTTTAAAATTSTKPSLFLSSAPPPSITLCSALRQHLLAKQQATPSEGRGTACLLPG